MIRPPSEPDPDCFHAGRFALWAGIVGFFLMPCLTSLCAIIAGFYGMMRGRRHSIAGFILGVTGMLWAVPTFNPHGDDGGLGGVTAMGKSYFEKRRNLAKAEEEKQNGHAEVIAALQKAGARR